MFGAMTRDDGKANGIIQLFNNPNPILPKDVRKLDAISKFFGQCVQNIEDLTKKLTTTLSVQYDKSDSTDKFLQTVMLAIQESEGSFGNLMKPFEFMQAQTEQTLIINQGTDQEIERIKNARLMEGYN